MQDSFFKVPPGITKMMQDFHAAIETLVESAKLLESFSGDYFVTLNESGFSEIRDIVEALSQTYEICVRRISSSRFEDANEILRYSFILKGKGEAPEGLKSELAYYYPFLESWSDRFTKAVKEIDKNIKVSSKNFQSVGAARKRNRSPTSTILGQIRGKILNNETISPAGKKKIETF